MSHSPYKSFSMLPSSPTSAPQSGTQDSDVYDSRPNMRKLLHEYDWSATSLGPLEDWPANLRAITDLMLDSVEPMAIWWGADWLQIYNDAYAPRVDGKSGPIALGQSAAATWGRGWALFEPFAQEVRITGASKTYRDFAFSVGREGKLKEAYWTLSLTPVRDSDGAVGGVLLLSSEITEQTLITRRQQTLDFLRKELAPIDNADQLTVVLEHTATFNRTDLASVKLLPLHASSLSLAMPFRVKTDAVEVKIDGDLAIEISPDAQVALDTNYRVFCEQFGLLVATAQGRIASEARRRLVEAERDRLLLDAPVGAAVMLGENLTYHLVNSVYAAVSGRPADDMVNKPFVEVYPELEGSPVHEKFKEVYRSGQPFVAEPTLVQIHRHGGALDDRYFTYNLSPLRTLAGEVFGLMVIAVDITTEVESRAHVEKLNVELRSAARAKDEFLAMLAHELRNPLAPIGAAAELLQIMKVDEKTVRHTSQVIGRQVRHMTGLVDDLLDVSRLTRGLVDLELVPLDIRHVVHDAVEQVTPLIQARKHHLALHLPPGTTNVNGDKKRLVQVVANILNNAAKYTPEGGAIVLSVDVHPSYVAIEVKDNGIGMDPYLASRAFDLFAQAERTPDRSSGGLGLGLALVKSLTELHGGQVSCDSPGPGKGSTFTVHLPSQAEAPDERNPQGVERDLGQNADSLRILVVDDNVDAASLLAMQLEASGHHVMVEHSSRRALERARQEAPHICILDIGLPEMDGYALAARLRAQPETANAVLIAITGYGRDEDREQTRAAGFAHHLVKPADIKLLASIIAEVRIG
jgi:PAS domain S-box-containing protein